MFKVYPRKIYVWCKGSPVTAPELKWFFAWNTNAYRTCKDAIAAAKAQYPDKEFKASFKW
jgi:hypothetical protein